MTPPQSIDAVRAKAREYAIAALNAVAVRNDWDAAATALQQASDELGGSGLEIILRMFCDTTIAAQDRLRGGQQIPEGAPTRPVWLNTETGQVGGADNVPPSVRWAGQLIAARAAMDLPAYNALLAALPKDDAEMSEHIARLLTMCAIAVKADREPGRPIVPAPRTPGEKEQ